MTDPAAEGTLWRRPPLPMILACVALIGLAEAAGGAMVKFKWPIANMARELMLRRPAVHGLVGVREVDEEVLDKLKQAIDAQLRLFHLHAEGMGLVILTGAMIVATVVPASPLQRWLYWLLGLGALYPLGYLAAPAFIIPLGLERGKRVAEVLFWIPFGGAVIVAMWVLTGWLAREMWRRHRTPLRPAGDDGEAGAR
ncbi:MAG TPA: hypothetical protein VED18_10160 [Candidatus Sulfotelmatobacter sp.]|nr:hypothetical protein [Candidatus Sulfotelmatobacter sp.]